MVRTSRDISKNYKRPIQHYPLLGTECLNNSSIKLVTSTTDLDSGKKPFSYDPHLDLQLVWLVQQSRKHFFEVPCISFTVHKRIDSHTGAMVNIRAWLLIHRYHTANSR